MQITDTIADLLTRIRNASTAKHATVDVPASNMKKSITQILVDEGYVKDFKIIEDVSLELLLNMTRTEIQSSQDSEEYQSLV